jgi:hypothetical protein
MTNDLTPTPEAPVPDPRRRHLPLHPNTKPLARWIEAIATWYDNAFGTPTAFAISLIALVGWLSLIPILGFSHWNSGPGLLGNTLESTGEWFFGLAVLIVGVSTAARQKDIESNQLHQMDRQVEMLAAIQETEERLAAVDTENGTLLRQNTELTEQVHDLAIQIHTLVSGAAEAKQ